MEGLGKKVGYLKGLMEGMDFSNDPSQGKLFNALFDVINDLSDRVESMEELLDDLNDYVESIDDDLAELEGGRMDGFDAPDEEYFDDEYEDYDDEEEEKLHILGGGAEDEDDEHETLAGSICSECGRMFFVAMEDPEDAKYDCPHCGKRIGATPLTAENAPIAQPVEE